MDSGQIITLAVVLIVFISLFGFVGKYFEKLPPKTLKSIDFASFTITAITGLALLFGIENVIIRYIFFASIIVWFIALRHSVHNNKAALEPDSES